MGQIQRTSLASFQREGRRERCSQQICAIAGGERPSWLQSKLPYLFHSLSSVAIALLGQLPLLLNFQKPAFQVHEGGRSDNREDWRQEECQ